MDEIIHINFDGYKTDTHYVSISKTRLWPSILASLRWILKNQIPGNSLIQGGLGLIMINNLAIVVEEFIIDILVLARLFLLSFLWFKN